MLKLRGWAIRGTASADALLRGKGESRYFGCGRFGIRAVRIVDVLTVLKKENGANVNRQLVELEFFAEYEIS